MKGLRDAAKLSLSDILSQQPLIRRARCHKLPLIWNFDGTPDYRQATSRHPRLHAENEARFRMQRDVHVIAHGKDLE